MIFALGLVVFFVLSACDFILTDAVIDKGGHESNPIIAIIMNHAGPAWRLVKMGMALVVILALWMVGPVSWGWAALAIVGFGQAYVVWHNATVLRRMSSK